MDDMLHQVLAMAEQTTDVVESLTMLATALAIDEQCSMTEANLCRLTEKGVRATTAAALTDADALTLAARAIAIFLEKQAAHHLQVQFTAALGKQLSVILRHMPRSVLVTGATPSSYAGAASAPGNTNNNNNKNTSNNTNTKGGAVASSSSTNGGLRFSTLTPIDFIEEVLRILQVYGVFKRSFAAVVDMPSDAVLLHSCLEWLPHVNRRVFPQLAAFCCSRIVVCSALALSASSASGSTFHPYRIDRSADLFLTRILKDELSASFQQEIIRVECLFKIGVCFATRAAVAAAAGNSSSTATKGGNESAGGFFSGLFGAATTATTTTTKPTTSTTTPGLLINTDFVEKMLKVVVDHLTAQSGNNNNNNNTNQTVAAVLTLSLRFLATVAYNNQILVSVLSASPSFAKLLSQLLQLGLTSKAIQEEEAENNTNNNNNNDDDAGSPTIDANFVARNQGDSTADATSSNLFNNKKKLQLPTLFATTAAATAAARLAAAAANNNNQGAGAGAGSRTNAKEFNGGVNDDVTLVLCILSLIVGPGSSSCPRIEPQLRWTWSSGEAEVDYTGDSCLTLTRALFSIGTASSQHRGLMVVPLHTPGGRFNVSFEYMAQLNAENKRPRSVTCSYLPDKLGVRGNNSPAIAAAAVAPQRGADDDEGAALAAIAAAFGGPHQSEQPLPAQVVDFLKSLFSFSNNSNLLPIMMNELWSLRTGDYKNVVEGVFLRLLQLGVWKELPMPAVPTTTTATTTSTNANSEDSSSLLQQQQQQSSSSSSSFSPAATIIITNPSLLFFGSVLVELLQNSPFAAATVECVQKDILQSLLSSAKSSTTEFDKWAFFLRSCGFSDILAASVQLPKEAVTGGAGDDDDEDHEVEAKATKESNNNNNNNNNKNKNNNNNKPGRGGKQNQNPSAAATEADAAMPNVPIDPKIAAKLLSMIGDCIESTSHHTIAQIMKRVTELSSSNNNSKDGNNNNNSPSRELRTLLSEFTKIVRTSRGQPRKLLKEITDTGVNPRHFAAFVASDTSLGKTLCRIAAASCFGAQPGARPTPAQANSALATCASNQVKIYTSAAATCSNGCGAVGGTLGPNTGAGSGTATCGACKSSSSRANTMFRCSLCSKIFCPSCVCGTAAGSGSGGGTNTTTTGISLIGCVGDWLRYIGTNSCNNAGASIAHLRLTKTAMSLLANSMTIPLSTPVAALVTVLTSNNNNRASSATGDIASIFGKRKVNQVLSQRKQHQDINLQISIVSENDSTNVFIREPEDHHHNQHRQQSSSTFTSSANNNIITGSSPSHRHGTKSAPTANHANTSVDNVAISSSAPSSSFGAQDVLHLQFLQSVCPHTLAETFTEELGAWLQASALDVCLAGMIGLHKKIHDCLPALKLAVPLAVRFELWRYTTIGGRRRALATLVEREMGPGGSVDLELTTRQVMEKFAIGVDRTTTSSPATTNNNNTTTTTTNNTNDTLLHHLAHNLSKFLIAPTHRRLDLYFRDEVGRGEGPTQEVYSEVARQVSSNPKLWVNDGKTFENNNNNNNNNDDDNNSSATTSSQSFQVSGYIPAAGTDQQMYTLGVVCGRALLDGYVVNVPLHELVFTFLTCTTSAQQQAAVRDIMLSQVVDPNFYRNVKKLADMKSDADLEATGLEYEEPSSSTTTTAKPSSKKAAAAPKSVALSTKNVHKYIEQTLAERFEPIRTAIEQFGRGVQRVVDFNFLKACFENHELPFVLGGISSRPGAASNTPLFTASELNSCIVPAHGYNHQSVQVQWLKEALLSFSPELQSDFVEFLTGSRGLPAGGVTNLSSVITVVKKQFDEGDTNAKQGTLPSCSTCFLYVKLPPYTSFETLKARLLVAIRDGRRNFSHT